MKRSLSALVSSKSSTWGTPPDFFQWLDDQLAFTVDVCALPSNAKCARFYSPLENGLARSWEGETAWCNPPYGRGIAQWVRKARDEALHARALVALLLPARVDTTWWRTFVLSADGAGGQLQRSEYDDGASVWWLRRQGLITGLYFHDERLAFDGEEGASDSAPFPSAVVLHAHPSRRPRARGECESPYLLGRWPR